MAIFYDAIHEVSSLLLCLIALTALQVSLLSGSAKARLVRAPSPVPNITRVSPEETRLRLDTQRTSPGTTYLEKSDYFEK